MVTDSSCRVCKGKTKQTGLLYRCLKKKCGSVFWDKTVVRKLIKEDPANENVIIADAEIPEVEQGIHFLYILRMRQSPDDKKGPFVPKEYIGETALHPYRRYLNHIIGKKPSNKHKTDRYATALTYFKGYRIKREVAQEKERQLVLKRRELGINAVGGHKKKDMSEVISARGDESV